jgi:serine phosphatase RsbU (regulator of sigma subunit)/pSer/pThr/pTyr-binding forkhead associated (FHA) protein
MPLLTFIKSAVNQGTTLEVDGERIVLGRNADCQVVLALPAVSREHAIIRRIQGKYYIEDNKSRNGTFVNDKEIQTRTQLKHKDHIKICDTVLAFYEKPPTDDDEEEDTSTIQATINQSSKQVLEAQPAERLQLLLEIGAELTQTFDMDELLGKIADRLFSVFRQADRAFVILTNDEGKLIPKVVKTRHNDETAARFSRRIVKLVLETGDSLLTADAAADARFDMSQSVADYKIRSVMCVPLVGRSDAKAFGVIQLDTQNNYKQFTREDLKLLLTVAGQAAIALENANQHTTIVARAGLERDLKLARDVQKSFLPKKMPVAEGYEFFAFYESAQEVGGDYYDFVPLPGPRWAIMCGDVAGKGVPAALLMAKVSSDARFCALTEPNFDRVIYQLNEHMQEAGLLDRFVTLGAGLLDPASHAVTFVNAGHLPPLIYRKAAGTFDEGVSTEQTGFPLGVADGIPYQAVPTVLGPGDCVLLFSDGVTESKNKDEKDFGMDGLLAALKDGPMTPRAMVERLVNAVHLHATGRKPHDDLTVVAFGRTS